MIQTRRIIAVHLEGGERHEHITKVIWIDPQISTIEKIESTKEQMVAFIDNNPGQTYVYDESTCTKILVGVVHVVPPYIRTYRDKKWQDNLLNLESY